MIIKEQNLTGGCKMIRLRRFNDVKVISTTGVSFFGLFIRPQLGVYN